MTAIEWLVEKVNSDCLNSTFIRKELIDEAKEMEKQQIMKFAIKAVTSAVNEDANNPYNLEQLFTKTYGSKGSETKQ